MAFAGLNLEGYGSGGEMTHMGTHDLIAPLDFEWQQNKRIFVAEGSDAAKLRDYS
jgi:hypothetical protein